MGRSERHDSASAKDQQLHREPAFERIFQVPSICIQQFVFVFHAEMLDTKAPLFQSRCRIASRFIRVVKQEIRGSVYIRGSIFGGTKHREDLGLCHVFRVVRKAVKSRLFIDKHLVFENQVVLVVKKPDRNLVPPVLF